MTTGTGPLTEQPVLSLPHVERHNESMCDQCLKSLILFVFVCAPVRWDEGSATSSVLPPVLLTRLSTARDADYHRGICLVIKFLINMGLELPSDFPRRIAREKEDRSKYRPLLYSVWASPMEMVLQSACPPFLFEVHLKRAILEQQLPPNLFKGNTGYYDLRQRYTTIDELLSLLFDDFFFRRGYSKERAPATLAIPLRPR